MSQQTLASAFADNPHQVESRTLGGLPLLYPILQALELRSTLNALRPSKADVEVGLVALLLVLNRLLAPKPLYQVGAWAASTVLPEVLDLQVAQLYDQRLGRALDAIYPVLGEAWARLAAGAVRQEGVDLSVLHWDITSFYFEGDYTDSALLDYGYSRDHRPDSKQANLELDVSHDACMPVLYHVLAGPTADATRPLPHLPALLAFLKRPELAGLPRKPLLVSDGKMVTAGAVVSYAQQGVHFLGPLADGVEATAVIRSVSEAELATHELRYRPLGRPPKGQPFLAYRGVWRVARFGQGTGAVSVRALVGWSAGKERLDIGKRKTYLKRLLDGLAHIRRQLNRGRYKKREYVSGRLAKVQEAHAAKGLVDIQVCGEDGDLRLDFRINRDRLVAAQGLDGKYVLVTNQPDLRADEALGLYKGQDKVEKRIGRLKGPLCVRPVFVHTDQRVEGVVFCTMVALLVRAILEGRCARAGLQVTADRLLRGFGSLEAIYVTFADGSQHREVGTLTPFQRAVLGALQQDDLSHYLALAC